MAKFKVQRLYAKKDFLGLSEKASELLRKSRSQDAQFLRDIRNTVGQVKEPSSALPKELRERLKKTLLESRNRTYDSHLKTVKENNERLRNTIKDL